jgi:hypothetical protein
MSSWWPTCWLLFLNTSSFFKMFIPTYGVFLWTSRLNVCLAKVIDLSSSNDRHLALSWTEYMLFPDHPLYLHWQVQNSLKGWIWSHMMCTNNPVQRLDFRRFTGHLHVRVWPETEHRLDMCRATKGAHLRSVLAQTFCVAQHYNKRVFNNCFILNKWNPSSKYQNPIVVCACRYDPKSYAGQSLSSW